MTKIKIIIIGILFPSLMYANSNFIGFGMSIGSNTLKTSWGVYTEINALYKNLDLTWCFGFPQHRLHNCQNSDFYGYGGIGYYFINSKYYSCCVGGLVGGIFIDTDKRKYYCGSGIHNPSDLKYCGWVVVEPVHKREFSCGAYLRNIFWIMSKKNLRGNLEELGISNTVGVLQHNGIYVTIGICFRTNIITRKDLY